LRYLLPERLQKSRWRIKLFLDAPAG
jgi:hypothetical protein